MPATLTHLSDVWRNYSDDGDTISKLSSTLYFGCSSRDQLVQSCQPIGAEDVIGGSNSVKESYSQLLSRRIFAEVMIAIFGLLYHESFCQKHPSQDFILFKVSLKFRSKYIFLSCTYSSEIRFLWFSVLQTRANFGGQTEEIPARSID